MSEQNGTAENANPPADQVFDIVSHDEQQGIAWSVLALFRQNSPARRTNPPKTRKARTKRALFN